MDICDSLDNYAFMWNIRGERWKREWTYHPEGIGREMDPVSEDYLRNLNDARKKALYPLIKMEEGFKNARTLKDQVLCLYQFLENIKLADRLEEMAERASADGENAMIQVFNQLWEILLNALEQLYDVLGFSTWDTENFVKLLKLLLSQYNVGTIPPVLDAVTVGSVSSLRFMQEKDLIILGATDGNFPQYTKKTGVLSDQERSYIRSLGIPLTGNTLSGMQSQFADIYNIFCGATDTITVSCPAGQPSYIYKRLLSMIGKETSINNPVGAADCNVTDAAAYIARNATRQDAERLDIVDAFRYMKNAVDYELGTVSGEGIQKLYGNKLQLSASKIDTVADCRLSYFLKYGIRAKERREATIDPMEFGTYVHDVLENTARDIKEKGGFHSVSLAQAIEIANHYAKVYAQTHFSQIDSERMSYLFNRNTQELEFIVTELWEELQHSEFEPFDFELGFGNGGKMDYIHFSGKSMLAKLEGKVDRVDVWNNGYQNYFRVVDYKTGSKDFDYCDIFNGIGLQMFLYLFALEENGEDILGKRAVPAGVQYFPARVPVILTDGLCEDEEIKNMRIAETKRKGLILQDDAVLHAMEDFEKPLRMNYSRKKDGSTSGSLADREQMKMLKKYIFRLLSSFVDDISSGCVTPNPYTRGSKHNPCIYCPYRAVCHPSYLEGRREFKEMSAQWFWDAVREENDKNG
jgi:ATP-dependent helicase/nuclease subunit B